MVKVSIIMPVYNTKATYLRQAIESILKQTYTDFEFLILDDSTTEGAEEIIKSYQDVRIKYFKNEKHLGIARSYNKLINFATGEYIALMNHDDISSSKRIALEVKFLDDNPDVGLVGTGYKKFGEYNRFCKVINPAADKEIQSALLFKAAIHNPTIMFRNSIIKENQIIYDPQFISLNDRKFYYDVGKVAKLANIQEVLYKYRFHPNMTSKLQHCEIVKEQHLFHSIFFAYRDVDMSATEREIFDNYITCGRSKIKDYQTLTLIKNILEKLVNENAQKHFMPEPEFSIFCGCYLVKKCRNAAVYGRINSTEILNTTFLPVNVPTGLKLWNSLSLRRHAA